MDDSTPETTIIPDATAAVADAAKTAADVATKNIPAIAGDVATDVPAGVKLWNDIIALEEQLKPLGVGVIQLLKNVASSAHGIKL